MTRLAVSLTVLLVIATPVAIWFDATGNPLYYLDTTVPPGQFLYVLSKLAGLLALASFWVQAMAALARGTPALQGFPRTDCPCDPLDRFTCLSLLLSAASLRR